MAVNRHYGTNLVDAGVSRQPMSLTGTLYNRVGLAVVTPGTVEATLLTLSIPKGVINGKGKGLHVRVVASTGAAGGTKTVRLRYGSLTGTLIASAAATASGDHYIFDADLFLTNESTGEWECYSWMLAPTADEIGGGRVSSNPDIQGDWTLAITGQSPNGAGDMTLRLVRVDVITEGGLS